MNPIADGSLSPESPVLSEHIKHRLKSISETTHSDLPSVEALFHKTYNKASSSSFFASIPEPEQHEHICHLVYKELITRPPSKRFTVLPLGFHPDRTLKSGPFKGQRVLDSFCLIPHASSKGIFDLHHILARGDELAYSAKSALFLTHYYDIQLAERYGSLLFTEESQYVDPHKTEANIIKILLNHDDIHLVPSLSEMTNYRSKLTDRGWPVLTDVAIVKGLVYYNSEGPRKDGTNWYAYDLGDESLGGRETVLPDGTVQSATVRIYVAKELVKYGPNTELYCVGNITEYQGKARNYVSMNAFMTIPVYPDFVVGLEG